MQSIQRKSDEAPWGERREGMRATKHFRRFTSSEWDCIGSIALFWLIAYRTSSELGFVLNMDSFLGGERTCRLLRTNCTWVISPSCDKTFASLFLVWRNVITMPWCLKSAFLILYLRPTWTDSGTTLHVTNWILGFITSGPLVRRVNKAASRERAYVS